MSFIKSSLKKKIKRSSESILKKLKGFKPEIGLILGSGLSEIGEEIKNPISIPYSKVPFFQSSTVDEDKSVLVCGELYGKKVMLSKYRLHYYEGYTMEEITFPVRVMKECGCKKILVTNSSGGVNEGFKMGDIMLIKDHINFSGVNPLRGKNWKEIKGKGGLFLDCSNVYDSELNKKILEIAKKMKFDLKEGVYMMLSGPSYETPSEVKMCRILGADCVGMSTVPEAIVANHSGMKVVGLSLITNLGTGLKNDPITHDEVLKLGNEKKKVLMELLKKIIPIMK